ncbi:MAG: peptidylprolyl isomerase [Bacteroidota bacterium]
MRNLYCFIILIIGFVVQACNGGEIPPNAEVLIKTDKGDVYIELFDETPIHKENFLKLAQEGFFDGMAFHRVVRDFVVQVGDPRTIKAYPPKSNTGEKNDAGYALPAEIIDTMAHLKGMIGAAREVDEINPERKSSSSQFYFVTGEIFSSRQIDSISEDRTGILLDSLYDSYDTAQSKGAFEGSFQAYKEMVQFQDFEYTEKQQQAYMNQGGALYLDGRYTLFGRVLKGMEAIESIERTATNRQDMPLKAIYIQEVSVLTQP